MPRIYVTIEGSRSTTRDGSHPDDKRYVEQIADSLREVLGDYGFHAAKVQVKIGE